MFNSPENRPKIILQFTKDSKQWMRTFFFCKFNQVTQ